jgi:hypothetical protein
MKKLSNFIIENFIAFFLFLFFLALLFLYYSSTYLGHHLDTSFLIELVGNTIDRKGMLSFLLNTSTENVATANLFSNSICSNYINASWIPFDVTRIHAYYAIYIFSYFSNFFEPIKILAFLNALTFSSIPLLCYFFLRHLKIANPILALFVFVLTLHPVFTYGSMGDFYMDRFTMPLVVINSIALYLLINSKPRKTLSFLYFMSSTLVILMTERAGIIILLTSFLNIFIFTQSYNPKNLLKAVPLVVWLNSFFILLYLFVYFKFSYSPPNGAGTLNFTFVNLLHSIQRFYSNPGFGNLLSFLLVNSIFFIPIFFSNFKNVLVFFVILLPNIIYNVGGAELTGWSTHYHSMYYAHLCFLSCFSLSKIKVNFDFKMRNYFYIFFIFFFIFNFNHRDFHLTNNFKGTIYYNLFKFFSRNTAYNNNLKAIDIQNAVPTGSKVSTIEGLLPILHENRIIFGYPNGINTADYVVIPAPVKKNGKNYYRDGFFSYKGQIEQDKAVACLNNQLKNLNFNVESPLLIHGAAILSKQN